jgi:hypothetical protein
MTIITPNDLGFAPYAHRAVNLPYSLNVLITHVLHD